jgi:hypothetical protein
MSHQNDTVFGGLFIGLMVTSAILFVAHNRELKRLRDDPDYRREFLGV